MSKAHILLSFPRRRRSSAGHTAFPASAGRTKNRSLRNIVIVLACAIFAASISASGESLRDQVKSAEALLAAGEAEKALAAFQQLQVDHPDAPEVILGVGASQYRAGELSLAGGLNEQARQHFSDAQQSFQRLFSNPEDPVRSSALFDYANAMAKSAKAYDTAKEFDKQVSALKAAVGAYEQVLRDFPQHAQARQNLDHTRYVLKKLLQNKPPDPDQQPPVIQLDATTELPGKEADVKENQVILQDQGQAPKANAPAPTPPAPAAAPAAPANPGGEAAAPVSETI